MSIKETVIIKEQTFNMVLQDLSDTYNKDLSTISFAALKNMISSDEWERVERSMNPHTFATREYLNRKVH